MLKIVPITRDFAFRFINKNHRHHIRPVGAKFWIGLGLNGNIVGVAICGRPVGKELDYLTTIEIRRCCVIEEVPNGCSKLYGACCRIAREMGYNKIITYILSNEPGISLKASGFILETVKAGKPGDNAWNSSGSRIRSKDIVDLFGKIEKYPSGYKQRWSRMLSKDQNVQASVATKA